jgi:hypothetical protein
MPVDAVNIALGRIRSSAGTVVLGYIAADAHWPGIAPPRSTDADEIDDAEARLFARALRAQGGGLDAHGLGILLANLLGLEVPGSSEAGRGSQVSSHATGAHMSCAQWSGRRKSGWVMAERAPAVSRGSLPSYSRFSAHPQLACVTTHALFPSAVARSDCPIEPTTSYSNDPSGLEEHMKSKGRKCFGCFDRRFSRIEDDSGLDQDAPTPPAVSSHRFTWHLTRPAPTPLLLSLRCAFLCGGGRDAFAARCCFTQ